MLNEKKEENDHQKATNVSLVISLNNKPRITADEWQNRTPMFMHANGPCLGPDMSKRPESVFLQPGDLLRLHLVYGHHEISQCLVEVPSMPVWIDEERRDTLKNIPDSKDDDMWPIKTPDGWKTSRKMELFYKSVKVPVPKTDTLIVADFCVSVNIREMELLAVWVQPTAPKAAKDATAEQLMQSFKARCLQLMQITTKPEGYDQDALFKFLVGGK
jgi:hypothetical protein